MIGWYALLIVICTTSAACHAPVAAPRVLVPFGATTYPRPWEWVKAPHPGVDIEVDEAGTVIAIADGTVVIVTDVSPTSVGVDVYIEHPAIGYVVGYQHFATVAVREGDVVRRGQVLGAAVRPGHSLGRVTGPANWIPHVHLEICPPSCGRRVLAPRPFMDPLPFITRCLSAARPGDVVWPVPC
jgi:murein DD-endopeptidase MepM/ murein hydrolase activator NlpD